MQLNVEQQQIAVRIIADTFSAATEGKLRYHESVDTLPKLHNDVVVKVPGDDLSKCRHTAIRLAELCEFDPTRTADLATAVSEAVMNSIVHGDDSKVELTCDFREVRVMVSDRGSGIPLLDLPNAVLKKGWSTKGTLGLGFPLVIASSDIVDLSTSPSGTVVIITKYKSEPLPALCY